MPRVPDEYLECVVYLYPSIPAAHAGQQIGGSGFVVRLDEMGEDFYYVVTNKHVVDGGSSTVRFNTSAHTHEAFEYDENHWLRSRDADLAIYLLPDPDPKRLKFRPVTVDQFVNDAKMKQVDVGVGSDVFFAGRFINVEGRDRNRPTLRFGTIAQVATDVIDGEESFLVEARSIPGFSGSPVFVYLPANAAIHVASSGIRTKGYGPFLLGVDWSHVNDYGDAVDNTGRKLSFRVRMNSGLMGVVPVWKLYDLLMDDRAMKERDKVLRKPRVATPDSATSGDAAAPANDANPNHREDFTRLLGEAARTRSQED